MSLQETLLEAPTPGCNPLPPLLLPLLAHHALIGFLARLRIQTCRNQNMIWACLLVGHPFFGGCKGKPQGTSPILGVPLCKANPYVLGFGSPFGLYVQVHAKNQAPRLLTVFSTLVFAKLKKISLDSTNPGFFGGVFFPTTPARFFTHSDLINHLLSVAHTA